ncbi:MAG TPA: hypothetical protein VM818_14990 [Vicinamibacterales bacterium]|nr:hypothetical protein [Vicinamibacterales bacterium]
MRRPTLTGWLAAAMLHLGLLSAPAADDVTLSRVFLTDGTALASYGEPARIGDRIVFSMPTAAAPNPPLQLVNLPASRVNWERTARYTEATRAARYYETQAELDYAALSSRMTEALNRLMDTSDVDRRLAIAQNARKMLAAWPNDHYHYRLAEVRQMLSLLDEAIADLRAASGEGSFALSLSAFAEPPTPVEPLAPLPTRKEAIEQLLAAADVTDIATDRTAFLETVLVGLERDEEVLPADWVTTTRAATRARFDEERAIDRAYQSLTTQIMSLADRHARAADVRNLTRLVDRVHSSNRTLGERRPDAVSALVAAVEVKLDAARRLRLARDRWALRQADFRKYRQAMEGSLGLFASLTSSLEEIKLLAGSSPSSLDALQGAVAEILKRTRSIAPPDEFRAAHGVLVSAVQMAGSAARIRYEATLAGDISRAWDASSAAAGALMLGVRAREEMQSLLRPPQLR